VREGFEKREAPWPNFACCIAIMLLESAADDEHLHSLVPFHPHSLPTNRAEKALRQVLRKARNYFHNVVNRKESHERHLNAHGPTLCAWLGVWQVQLRRDNLTPWTSAGVLFVRSEIDGSRDGSPTFFEVPLSSTKCPMPPGMQNSYPLLSSSAACAVRQSQVLHLGLRSRELRSLPKFGCPSDPVVFCWHIV